MERLALLSTRDLPRPGRGGTLSRMSQAPDRLVRVTESLLTWRRRRRARHKLRQSRKHVVRDWIEAFLQAALLVLLINQYLLQAYQIPSGSMIDTLLLGDRIFVNKVIYGPELLPGVAKLPGFVPPRSPEVVIFENPSYISRGTLFTIAQRVLYMVTLSLVDIDRDESGQPRAQLLIKRAVGAAGDRFRLERGDIVIRPAGSDEWISEAEYRELTGFDYSIRRTLDAADYAAMERGAQAQARGQVLDLPLSADEQDALARLRSIGFGDPFAFDRSRSSELYAANPDAVRIRRAVQFARTGWYTPANRIFPLGDNRDNSRDARYFGAVPVEDVLGRAMFIYWPIPRFGSVR